MMPVRQTQTPTDLPPYIHTYIHTVRHQAVRQADRQTPGSQAGGQARVTGAEKRQIRPTDTDRQTDSGIEPDNHKERQKTRTFK